MRDAFFAFIEAFLPFRCHACQHQTTLGTVLCDACCAKIAAAVQSPFVLDDVRCDIQAYTLSDYCSFIADTVKIIKYRPSRKLAETLIKACLDKVNIDEIIKPDNVLVPVPMHKARLRKRGFNQAEVIATYMVAKAGCHFSPALVRSVATRPQADCDEQERLTNLDNAFALNSDIVPEAFLGKDLVLVDDVATTGTTLQKCADVLYELRPASVKALVLSHSFRRSSPSLKSDGHCS